MKYRRVLQAMCSACVDVLKSTLSLSSSLQAIFELSRGEQDLIEDLQLARKVCILKHLKQWESTQNR